MKKLASLFLTIVFILGIMPGVSAQPEIRVVLNGKQIEFDQAPVIISDRTMVPVRAIYEALGAEVSWDAQTRTASGTKDGTTVTFVIDEAFVMVNENKKKIDAPACIVNDRTLVPVRALAEGFNTMVDWDAANRIVFLYDGKYAETSKAVKTGISLVHIKNMDTKLHPVKVMLSGEGKTDFSDVNVTKTGKNILDISKVKLGANAADMSVDSENGAVTFRKTSPVASASYVYTDIYLPEGTYNLSGESKTPENLGPSIQVYDKQNAKYINKNVSGYKYNDGLFVVSEAKEYQLRFYAHWNHKVDTVISFDKLQLECNPVATEFEKYNGQTMNAKADGSVLGLLSSDEETVIIADSSEVLITCEYLGKNITMPMIVKKDKLLHGEKIQALENCLKKNKTLEFMANIESFDSLIIRHGDTSVYSSSYILIDSSEVKVYNCHNNEILAVALSHDLSFDKKISVSMEVNALSKLSITLSDGKKTFSKSDILWAGSHGMIEAESVNSHLTDVSLKWNSPDYEKDIWVLGDSWVQIQSNAWPMYLISENDTFLLSGYGGSGAVDMYKDWLAALEFGTPKYAVWTIGMNNPDNNSGINTSWKQYTDMFIADCNKRGITPILVTIPNSAARTHIHKNEYIKSSGCRYIDFAKAMGAEEAGSSWTSGYTDDGGIHANVKGALVLVEQIKNDFPEIK